MKKLIGIILLLLLFFSCSKQSSTVADSIKAGRVMDGNTGKPLPNTWVYLLKKSDDATPGAWGMQTINSHQTNKDGYFNFDYSREDNYTYYLVAESEPLYGRTDFILLKKGNQYPLLKMYGAGWIRFHVVNVPPMDTLTYFKINQISKNINTNYLHIDTSFVSIQLPGNKNNIVEYVVQKRSTPVTYHRDTFYVPALDTVTYTIKY